MSEKIEQKDSNEQPAQTDDLEESATDAQGPEWLSELDSYPLRAKEEDPKWAVRTVWIWLCIALALTTFFIILLILGAIYD
jgi:hypothetical protein